MATKNIWREHILHSPMGTHRRPNRAARQGWIQATVERMGRFRAEQRFSLPSPPTKQHELVFHMGTEWLAHIHSSSANMKVTDMETSTSTCFDGRA